MNRNIKITLGIVIIVFSLIASYIVHVSFFSNKRCNFILITIDTLRADHLSCYGYKRFTTPNIDKLAKNGVLFKYAYTQIPLTVPSHASIMTSLYPEIHGIKDNDCFLEHSFVTLAEILKKNNYNTAAIVSAFCLRKEWGLNQGFDLYLDVSEYQEIASRVTRLAKKHIKKLENPFFIWLHYFDPHAPYTPPVRYQKLYKKITRLEVRKLEERRDKIVSEGGEPAREDLRKLMALYDGEIRFVDNEIGKIFHLIEKLGLRENTFIFVTGDHGEGFEHNYFFDHGDRLYEELLRVPLIILGPENKIPKGKIINNSVRLIDLMPTSLELLKIKCKSNDFQGVSLLPMIKKNISLDLKVYSELVFREFFSQAKSDMISLRDGEWKLIVCTDRNKRTEANSSELYNIIKDPAETINLIEIEKYTSTKLHNSISDWEEIMRKNAFKAKKVILEKSDEVKKEILEKMRALGYIK